MEEDDEEGFSVRRRRNKKHSAVFDENGDESISESDEVSLSRCIRPHAIDSDKDQVHTKKINAKQIIKTARTVSSASESGGEEIEFTHKPRRPRNKRMVISDEDEDESARLRSKSFTKKIRFQKKATNAKHKQVKNEETSSESDVTHCKNEATDMLCTTSTNVDLGDPENMSSEEESVLKYKKVGNGDQSRNQNTTPINDQSCDRGKQSRSSTRLKEKLEMKGSMKLPERRKILDQIEDFTPQKDNFKKRRTEPRKLINSFFKEKSAYNCDRFETYLSEDDYDEDKFIVDDEEYIEYEGDYSEDEKPGKIRNNECRRGRRRRRKSKKKFLSSCSSSDCSDSGNVKPSKSTRLHLSQSESSTDSSNVELNVSVKKEKNRCFILKSESEEDVTKEVCDDVEHNVKLLPKRRNKERERKQRAAAILKRKRELAQSKLPLDRRKFLEKEIDEEISSDLGELFEEELDLISTNCGVFEYENYDIATRDSDKEFIASSSDSEINENKLKTDEEFKLCLEYLRKSKSNFTEMASSWTKGASLTHAENDNKAEVFKYHRVLLDNDSSDDTDDKDVADLFKQVHKQDCNTAVIRNLIREHESLLDSTDHHGRKPLHAASIVGSSQVIKTLLDIGANANALDRKNMLSISYAAYWKHSEVLQLLLKHTNLAAMHRLIHKHLNGFSLLHLIVLDVPLSQEEDIESRQLECLKVVKEYNAKMYSSLLKKADKRQLTPILAVIHDGSAKCLEMLLSENQSLHTFRTDLGGTVLHLAVEFSDKCKDSDKSACLQILLGHFKDLVDEPDSNGFTPLLYATETGNIDCMKALLDHGATVAWQDNEGTTALHLAAAIGSTDCVKLLLGYGHPVDIPDDCGWPPLLYANFQSCESCVVELMKVKPKQLFVLSSLLNDCDPKQKEKNLQVVRSTILSLANQDAYYQIFNDFIRENTALLDEFNYGIFTSTWNAILDFDNKRRWFRKRVTNLRRNETYRHITVRRGNVLGCAMEFFEGQADLDLKNLNVMFMNEPGICSGPKKEFLICLCNEAMLPETNLFTKIDDQQFSPTALNFFADLLWSKCSARETAAQWQTSVNNSPQKIRGMQVSGLSPTVGLSPVKNSNMKYSVDIERQDDHAEITREQITVIKTELSYKLKAMHFLGRFIAACIADAMYTNLHLSKPFIKQILGQDLKHPDDLQSVDNGLYNGMVKWVMENSVDDMEMPFSINCRNPWIESKIEEIKLSKIESILTDKNKEEFTISVSRFKLCDSINREVEAFKTGFYQELSRDLISIFTPDEFSLLMNGVQNIDVNDWKENTKYVGWNSYDNEIIWFWRAVNSMKQDEKALLLKFCTGSPCVPSGGFKELEGLGGRCPFTIGRVHGNSNSLPTAATCFNMLELSNYSSEKNLREKVLIAIRHGSEGFDFA